MEKRAQFSVTQVGYKLRLWIITAGYNEMHSWCPVS